MTAVEERPTESLYGDEPTFTFHPSDGSEPIVFPKSEVLWETVDGVTAFKFLWKIRKLNEAYQSYEFMDRAKVPDEIQERVVDLPDDERREFFASWFKDLSDPPEAGLPPEQCCWCVPSASIGTQSSGMYWLYRGVYVRPTCSPPGSQHQRLCR